MNLHDLEQIVAAGESETVEFKKSTAQLPRAGETLCAFLNGQGGRVFIGVTAEVVVRFRPKSHSLTPQVTPEVTPEVGGMLSILKGEMNRNEIMAALGLGDEKHFRQHYQQTAVVAGLVEMTIPDKPRSRLQKCRLTAKGRAWLPTHQPAKPLNRE